VPAILGKCCGVRHPDQEAITYFLARFNQDFGQKPKSEEEGKKSSGSATLLGASLRKFYQGLSRDQLLLMACGWDYVQAMHLYKNVDHTVTTQIVEDFLKYRQEHDLYLYEATLYGFGGKYKDEDSVSSTAGAINITGMSASDIKGIMGL